MKKFIGIFAALLCLMAPAAAWYQGVLATPSVVHAAWQQLKIGGGGFDRGIDISNDGTTKLLRTDTYGAYLCTTINLNGTCGKWSQIVTTASMPGGGGGTYAFIDDGQGVYEIRVAPNTPTQLYMFFAVNVFTSSDRGTTWTATSFQSVLAPTITGATDNGSGLIRITVATTAMTFATGDQKTISGVGGTTEANGNWTITAVDATHFDLQGSAFVHAYTSGGAVGVNPSSNDANSVRGPKMAVDPANSNVVYVGTPSNGVRFTTDGGATFSTIPATTITQLVQGIGYAIAFDPTSGITGGKTNKIYICAYGTGCYISTDAGTTWNLTTNTPTGYRQLVVSPVDGTPYLIDAAGFPSGEWKYNGSAWVSFSPGGITDNYGAILPDPNNASRVVLVSNTEIATTLDAGSTWTFATGTTWSPNCTSNPVQKRVALDVPWLATTNECALTIGNARFDPSAPNLIHLAEGIGGWSLNIGSGAPSTVQTWVSESAGLEQMVTNWLISPTGGKPSFLFDDRPIFYQGNLNLYPSYQSPNTINAINYGYHADWSPADPNYVVLLANFFGSSLVEQSGYSINGGQSFIKFAALPAGLSGGGNKNGGALAVSADALSTSPGTANLCWVQSNNGNVYYSKTGGASWTLSVVGTIPTTGTTGWGTNNFVNRHILTADRVNAGTFYIYNYGPPGFTGTAGIWQSTDGCVTWTQFLPGAALNVFATKIASVPGKAGELFTTQGQLSTGGSHIGAFGHVVFSGGMATFTAVPNMLEVYAFGFGAIKPGNDYPSVYAAGYLSGVWGVWQSDSSAAQWAANTETWTQRGPYPLNSFDSPTAVSGDMNTYGVIYYCTRGSACAYYTP